METAGKLLAMVGLDVNGPSATVAPGTPMEMDKPPVLLNLKDEDPYKKKNTIDSMLKIRTRRLLPLLTSLSCHWTVPFNINDSVVSSN